MRLKIIGKVCRISASATAIEPTKMPTQMPYIAISHLILEPKPKLPAIMDDKFPQMTPQIITFSTRIMLLTEIGGKELPTQSISGEKLMVGVLLAPLERKH